MSAYTVLSGRVGYRIGDGLNLYLNAGGSLQRGIMDPALGIGYMFVMAPGFMGLLSLQAAAPLSQYSRDVSRITTITTAFAPTYNVGKFSFGATTFFSYNFYSPSNGKMPMSGTPTSGGTGDMGGGGNTGGGGMGGMNMARSTRAATNGSAMPMSSVMGMSALETFRFGGNLAMGYDFTRMFGASTGLGLSASYREDSSSLWMTDITVARLSFTIEKFSVSGGFNLMSDMMQYDAGFAPPTLPFINLGVRYVFGNESSLGGGPGASCMAR